MLTRLKTKNEKFKQIIQFLTYTSVGASNVLIDIIVLNTLWKISGVYTGKINYIFKFISFCIYSTTGYLLNKKITFQSDGSFKAYIKYVSLLAGLSAIDAVMIVHLTVIHFNNIPVKLWSNLSILIAAMSTGIIGFIINKFLIFSKNNDL